MLEAALVVVRLAQYAGVAILFGSSIFFLYALPRDGSLAAASVGWPRRLLLVGAVLTFAGGVLGLGVQTAVMAGSLVEGLKPESLGAVISGTQIGQAGVARAALGAAVLVMVLALKPGRALWTSASALGALATASLAWMGHAAANEGPGGRVHLVADILHSLAAAAWLGALAGFLMLLRPRPDAPPEHVFALHHALRGFSGIGAVLVASLVATGLVNSWFLVGADAVPRLWATEYGLGLTAKLALFVGMIALAAANRFRLTPSLGRAMDAKDDPADETAALRRSVILETMAGAGVVALVAWFGTLEPPAA